MLLSIIIPTRDKASRLRLCLRALAEAMRQSDALCEIIVVNDGSRDDTAAVVTTARDAFEAPYWLVQRDTTGGRSVARNDGAAHASGVRLLFLDDDVLISAAVLERHYHVRDTFRPVIARATILNLPWLRATADPARRSNDLPKGLASRLIRDDISGSIVDSIAPYARRSRFEADLHRLLTASATVPGRRWPAATGGNLSVPHEFFDRIGGFDERMGLRWGAEDLEFGFRAEAAGATILHFSDATAYHMDHKVVDREVDHLFALRYFGEKHDPSLGQRLIAYFAGKLDITAVVQP